MTIGSAGTRLATEACGQLRPWKFRSTFCEYWIWVVEIVTARPGNGLWWAGIEAEKRGTRGTGTDGCTGSRITGCAPGCSGGTRTSYSTVSIQKIASIWKDWALGPGVPDD